MVNFAIVENGEVVNVAVGDKALGDNWVKSSAAQIGWTYTGGKFSAPVVPPPPVPTTVTMRQARLALLQAGLLATVEAAVSASPDAVKIEWEYSQTVERGHSWVQQLGEGLQLDLDALFTLAAGL